MGLQGVVDFCMILSVSQIAQGVPYLLLLWEFGLIGAYNSRVAVYMAPLGWGVFGLDYFDNSGLGVLRLANASK